MVALALALALVGVVPIPAPGPEMLALIDDQALIEALERRERLDELGGLSDEREQVDELRDALDETERRLREQMENLTPREVLEALEERAHEAERLASELNGDQQLDVHDSAIAELERTADTAPLAEALRSGDNEAIRDELERLAERLEDPDLSLSESERIARAMERAANAAQSSREAAGEQATEAEEALASAASGLDNGRSGAAAERLPRSGRSSSGPG